MTGAGKLALALGATGAAVLVVPKLLGGSLFGDMAVAGTASGQRPTDGARNSKGQNVAGAYTGELMEMGGALTGGPVGIGTLLATKTIGAAQSLAERGFGDSGWGADLGLNVMDSRQLLEKGSVSKTVATGRGTFTRKTFTLDKEHPLVNPATGGKVPNVAVTTEDVTEKVKTTSSKALATAKSLHSGLRIH